MNTTDTAMVIRSVRLPRDMADAIDAAGHPGGATGVIREALAAWLAAHGGAVDPAEEATAALATIARVLRHQGVIA